jgi:hypothetical protein
MSYKVMFDTVLLRSLKSILQDPRSRETISRNRSVGFAEGCPLYGQWPRVQLVLACSMVVVVGAKVRTR